MEGAVSEESTRSALGLSGLTSDQRSAGPPCLFARGCAVEVLCLQKRSRAVKWRRSQVTAMNEDPHCKRCEHSFSVHNMRRAEKRAKMTGTMVSDYPSGQSEFNYHSGKTDGDACSAPDCDCIMFISAF